MLADPNWIDQSSALRNGHTAAAVALSEATFDGVLQTSEVGADGFLECISTPLDRSTHSLVADGVVLRLKIYAYEAVHGDNAGWQQTCIKDLNGDGACTEQDDQWEMTSLQFTLEGPVPLTSTTTTTTTSTSTSTFTDTNADTAAGDVGDDVDGGERDGNANDNSGVGNDEAVAPDDGGRGNGGGDGRGHHAGNSLPGVGNGAGAEPSTSPEPMSTMQPQDGADADADNTNDGSVLPSAASTSLTSGAVAGIVVGSVLAAVLIAVLAYFIWRERSGEKAGKVSVAGGATTRGAGVGPVVRNPMVTPGGVTVVHAKDPTVTPGGVTVVHEFDHHHGSGDPDRLLAPTSPRTLRVSADAMLAARRGLIQWRNGVPHVHPDPSQHPSLATVEAREEVLREEAVARWQRQQHLVTATAAFATQQSVVPSIGQTFPFLDGGDGTAANPGAGGAGVGQLMASPFAHLQLVAHPSHPQEQRASPARIRPPTKVLTSNLTVLPPSLATSGARN